MPNFSQTFTEDYNGIIWQFTDQIWKFEEENLIFTFFHTFPVGISFLLLLFPVIILLGVISFNILDRHYRNLRFYRLFIDGGYTFSSQFEKYIKQIETGTVLTKLKTSAPKPEYLKKGDINFHIQEKEYTVQENEFNENRFKTTTYKKGVYILNVNFPYRLSSALDLYIYRRGEQWTPEVFDRNNVRNLNDQMLIRGTNAHIINNILSDQVSRKIISDLLCYTQKIDFESGTRFYVEKSIHRLKSVMDQVVTLATIVENLIEESYNEQRITVKELEAFNFEIYNLRCIICRREVVLPEITILNCCGSAAHEKHIRAWLEKDRKCPYCKKLNIELLKPKLTA